MRAGLARFRAKRTCHGVLYAKRALELDPWTDAIRMQETRQTKGLETITPAAGRALSVRQAAERKSAGVGSGGNARNVRTIEADIGQFAIAELGQFADIALIIPECLDHADERE